MATPDLPKKYKACVYDKPGTVSTKVEQLDMPEPGQGEVLINLTHSGVCHSDYGVMTNALRALPFPTQAGQVGGHEGIGKIVKMGPGTDNSAVKLGDRVGIKWMAVGKFPDITPPGTFQQYVCSPANYVTPIPDGLDSASAAPMLCAGVTVYSALRKCNAEAGNFVVISGAGGGLGHLAIQFSARAIGHRVIGIDHSSKKDLILSSGAEHFIPVDGTPDIAESVRALTNGHGAHAVLIMAGNNAAYAKSLDMLRFGGRVVCVGAAEGDPVPIASADPSTIVGKALSIVGSLVGTRKEAIDCLDFAARGIVKTHFRVEKMEALTGIFEEMERGEVKGRVVLELV